MPEIRPNSQWHAPPIRLSVAFNQFFEQLTMKKTSKLDQFTPQQPTPDDASPTAWEIKLEKTIAKLNKTYAVVPIGGKTFVLKQFTDPDTGRIAYQYINKRDFEMLYSNQKIQIGVKTNSEATPITKTVGEAWLQHPNRRQFLDGIVFEPSTYANGVEKRATIYGDKLNQWHGYPIKPKQGATWQLLDLHLRLIVCQGDDECYQYLLNWIARGLQYPNLNGQVAVVLKGEKGCGKGLALNFLKSLYGQHGVQINNTRHLTGNFNAHFADCCFLYADEVFFAGDKQGENVLKGLVTEPTLMVERKGIDTESITNRLKIVMSSNNDWIVPASSDERRYFVVEVASEYRNKKTYFDPLRAELDNPDTKAAFLFDMLRRDISQFDVHNVPETDALKHQRAQSLDSFGKFWIDVLERGYIYQSQHNTLELNQWIPEPATDLIRAGYTQWCNTQKIGQFGILTSEQIGKHLAKWGHERKQKRTPLIIGETHTGDLLKSGSSPRYYRLGSLDDAIKSFCDAEKIQLPEIKQGE
jgi:hypothetical protein